MGYIERYLARRAIWLGIYETAKPLFRQRAGEQGVLIRMPRCFAEVSESGKDIDVHFPYNPDAVRAIREIPGRKFVPKDKGGPYWRIPLDLTSGRRLRETFGDGLELGNALKAWGRDEVQRQRNLGSMSIAESAKLTNLPKIHPDLMKFISARPYQTADIKLMSLTNVLNANQPGTGKTIEVIGSLIESGLWDEGPHLVIAPVRSLVNVWVEELEWLGLDVFTAENPDERKIEVREGIINAAEGFPCVICVNPDMIRLTKLWDPKKSKEGPPPKEDEAKRDHKGNIYGYRNELCQKLLETQWKSVTIDEFHMHGLPNRLSLFSLGVSLLKTERKFALSGTPMGGVPRKLWPVLHWLEPDEYPAEWRWIDAWLEVEREDVVTRGGVRKTATVGGIIPGREDEFYRSHARHMIRRIKREALPGLPDQVHIVVKCEMTATQKKQYEQFQADAEVRIDGERLSSKGVLSEYTRLKQFANARQKLVDGTPFPTEDSGKLKDLLEKLDEEGIRKTDPEPSARALVASESSRMVYMVAEFLKKKGIDCDTFTGDTKDSKPLIERFLSKDPKPYVLVMTTQTGGVSLNLETAGSVHALDEMWNPDRMEQLFDRGDRGSRTTALRCYTYRTKETIQEYIAAVAEGKKVTNDNILDIRRRMFIHDETQA